MIEKGHEIKNKRKVDIRKLQQFTIEVNYAGTFTGHGIHHGP